MAAQCLQEYELNLKGVREAFNQFIYEHDASEKAQSDVVNDLMKLLELRFKNNAPRRPPRIIIAGPPGAGKETQAAALSRVYGLVHVSTKALLKKEIHENREFGKTIADCFDNGDPIPDHITNNLLQRRLMETDCKVNGWVLEGFPSAKAQINLLRAMKIKPLLVFVLEQNEEESVRRLSNKQLDPETGMYYNIEVTPAPEEINGRLKQQECDTEPIVRKKFKVWREFLPVIEEAFRSQVVTMQSDRMVDEITEMMSDEIENSMRA